MPKPGSNKAAGAFLDLFGEIPLEKTDLTAEDFDTLFSACSREAGCMTTAALLVVR
jgi:hypothetical protein